MMNKKDKFRSAIKEKPLRRAGQSIEEKLESIFDNQLLAYVMGVGLSFGLILVGWVVVLFPFTLKDAVILTVVGITVEIICIKKILKIKDEIKYYREGLRGERFMGDHLDILRETGCKVFHDFIVKDKDIDGNMHISNVDHIIVNNKGIYAIETKALRKSKIQNEELSYDGYKITYNDGRKLKKQPLKQAIINAKEIQLFLANNIGEEYNVQPVVVFPNWFVKPSTNYSNKSEHKVWVCNHAFLDGLINSGPEKLTQQNVNVISSKLSEYIRNYESKK